jgi:hypothetical protein
MVEPTTINLFEEDLSCRDCLFNWHGFVHGFSRGHAVLEKSGTVLFISDDIGYAFPRDSDLGYIDLVTSSGWRYLESCPRCGSRDLFPPRYDQGTIKSIPCISIEPDDLKSSVDGWSLTETGRRKIEHVDGGGRGSAGAPPSPLS